MLHHSKDKKNIRKDPKIGDVFLFYDNNIFNGYAYIYDIVNDGNPVKYLWGVTTPNDQRVCWFCKISEYSGVLVPNRYKPGLSIIEITAFSLKEIQKQNIASFIVGA